jgi:hypothetical protein
MDNDLSIRTGCVGATCIAAATNDSTRTTHATTTTTTNNNKVPEEDIDVPVQQRAFNPVVPVQLQRAIRRKFHHTENKNNTVCHKGKGM